MLTNSHVPCFISDWTLYNRSEVVCNYPLPLLTCNDFVCAWRRRRCSSLFSIWKHSMQTACCLLGWFIRGTTTLLGRHLAQNEYEQLAQPCWNQTNHIHFSICSDHDIMNIDIITLIKTRDIVFMLWQMTKLLVILIERHISWCAK